MTLIIDTGPKAKALAAWIQEVRRACYESNTNRKVYDSEIDDHIFSKMPDIICAYLNNNDSFRSLAREIMEDI